MYIYIYTYIYTYSGPEGGRRNQEPVALARRLEVVSCLGKCSRDTFLESCITMDTYPESYITVY